MDTRLYLISLALVGSLALSACDSTKDAADGTPNRMPEPSAAAPSADAMPRSDTPPSDDRSSMAAKGEQSTGKVVDDAWITTKTKTALLAESDLKAASIQVETKQGKVMLTGKVPSAAQSEKATMVARRIEGVTDVSNQLTVSP